MRMEYLRWAITGSGGFSRGMPFSSVGLGVAHVITVDLRGQVVRHCGRGIAGKFACKAHTLWPGAPPKPEAIWRDTRAKSGVAPGHKRFFPASALLVVFMVLFLSFQVLVWC